MSDWNTLVIDKLGDQGIPVLIANTAGMDNIILNGCLDVIERIRRFKPQLLPIFTSTTTQDGATLAVGNMDILTVTANHGSSGTIPARFVSVKEYNRANNALTSIYDITINDPVWTMQNGTIKVLPASGYTNYSFDTLLVPTSADASADANGSNPANFPVEYNNLVALYAAVRVLNYIALGRMKVAMDNMTTTMDGIAALNGYSALDGPDFVDIQDCIDNAAKLVDVDLADDDGGIAESALYWLNDEDSDMVSATLSVAAQELSRASTLMTSMDKKFTMHSKFADLIPTHIQEITGILTIARNYEVEYDSFFVDKLSKEGKTRGVETDEA